MHPGLSGSAFTEDVLALPGQQHISRRFDARHFAVAQRRTHTNYEAVKPEVQEARSSDRL
ncbi:hypothetical protein RIEGSTA812A_PEG_1012 [invertebrate metagenome]|uniref:Uncharacterized protein n=1 Tax=invertebrate metagenome TaxID=1711999 RepID=A0A484H6B3_9ZZZZ